MPRAFQSDLFGGIQVAGNLIDRLEDILERYPEARDDYAAACARYWIEYDGLGELLGPLTEPFVKWFVSRAKSPKTLQNRIMEIQSRRSDLEARPEVEEARQRQAKAGPVVY